ncbi:MAG: hypothetical protein ACREIT_05625, partial [Tepidisphaeraceae bacterium]
LNLLHVQLDYSARVGAWGSMTESLPTKVQLAELLPADRSAKAQALLALACGRTGRSDWSEWLRRRVELLADVQQLAKERPILWELWAQA